MIKNIYKIVVFFYFIIFNQITSLIKRFIIVMLIKKTNLIFVLE